ncbi:MAG: L,D-transpeptidase family protein [Gammaproteobacteria bacterium]|nr:L,D-transpeptidase family protein [Gammaproteobacteria bacterium]MDH3806218.1 L,D-transpeptidase family protein [Gammaproteobacteria bacterium]
MIRKLRVILVLGVLVVNVARAEIYELPPQGYDVIGAVSTITARHEDTLVDIARRHGLGYEDIVRANPHVNIWLPGAGTEIILPTRFVLPAGPRRGVVLNLAEYRLYYFPEPKPGAVAYVMTYPISIGRMDWETPLGMTKVISKVRNPSWYVPQSVLDEHAADGRPLERIVPPGPDNPLGEYAMRLGLPGYLIHGTNRPAGVGMRVTHGCVRMFPEDIEYLFGKIDVSTPVRIINDPVKMGWNGDQLIMEVHPVLEVAVPLESEDVQEEEQTIDPAADVVAVKDPLSYVTEQFIVTTGERAGQLDWHLAEQIVDRSDGIPTPVGEEIKNAAASAASY